MEFWVIVVAFFGLMLTVGNVSKYLRARIEMRMKDIGNKIREIEIEKLNIEAMKKQNAQDKEAIKTLANEQSLGFPWLAEAYSDYFHFLDLKKASNLELKSRPAPKAAEEVRAIASKRRTAEKLYRVLKYRVEYYEKLFPWLDDLIGEDLDDVVG